MAINAGTKVRIKTDSDGKVTEAVIAGCTADGTPTYRCTCPDCQKSRLTRHVLDGHTACIL